jgi:hypothetical protein
MDCLVGYTCIVSIDKNLSYVERLAFFGFSEMKEDDDIAQSRDIVNKVIDS